MYVTRRLSQLLKSPESLTQQPDGPNSGFLVIQDAESETYTCFGSCKDRALRELPFPQNKELKLSDADSVEYILLIPVLNQPLSSNRYYAIVPHGKHKGSRENIKIDVAAQGLDSKLRARLPEFDDLCISLKSSQPCRVGKWYCPFVFVKEGTLRDQVERSMYYEMTLAQRWEQIFTCQKNTYDNPGNSVAVDSLVEKEEVFVEGVKALWSEKNVADGVIWFTSYGPGGGETRVGLRVEIVERMKWEQARAGWVGGEERQVKIDRVEEFKGVGEWSVFGCYVLVERFNLKRMDGSLVMSYAFKHCQQVKTKWE
ncbi:hypothetical protein BUALT_Bualt05G0135300 [Buddleja alternifolia]|uniref:Uncharacterized protein n=1 Tax=Buddleja alternifolia TaxID=168488 RepID=A0AAV6XNB1_9LAMI|nr:hypothetical protein BUALT_Bualt05G0135300 [Buddleja alternifolia]